MKAFAFLATLSLTACVSTSEVVPAGHDYLITSLAKGGMNSGKGVIEATQKANAYFKGFGPDLTGSTEHHLGKVIPSQHRQSLAASVRILYSLFIFSIIFALISRWGARTAVGGYARGAGRSPAHARQ
jgi:hypothetical protein